MTPAENEIIDSNSYDCPFSAFRYILRNCELFCEVHLRRLDIRHWSNEKKERDISDGKGKQTVKMGAMTLAKITTEPRSGETSIKAGREMKKCRRIWRRAPFSHFGVGNAALAHSRPEKKSRKQSSKNHAPELRYERNIFIESFHL